MNERRRWVILLCFCLLLSLYAFSHTYVISLDGAFQYIPMAKAFVSRAYTEGLNINGQQPLYPFLIAAVSRGGLDFESAGRVVSSFFGILMIIPVYLAGRRLVGRPGAFLAAVLLAIHPYVRRYSADVLKESTYLFFLAVATWFTVRTFQRDRVREYLFVPLFSLLPYLVRPDGMEILLVAFFSVLVFGRFEPPKRRWVALLFLLLSSVVLFLPNLLYLKALTGEWTISKTKDLAVLLGYRMIQDGIPVWTKLLYSFKKLNLEILSVYHPLFFFLFCLGLWRARGSLKKPEMKFLLSLAGLHYMVLFLLILNMTDWKGDDPLQDHLFSGRHVLPLLLFTITWAGEGTVALHRWVDDHWKSPRWIRGWNETQRNRTAWALVIAILFAIVLPKTLKPYRYDKLSEKWAGIWIRNQREKGNVIFTTVPRVAYYADRPFQSFDLERIRWNEVKASMKEKEALYLVVRVTDLPRSSKGDTLEEHFMEVMRYEKEGMERLVIYKRTT